MSRPLGVLNRLKMTDSVCRGLQAAQTPRENSGMTKVYWCDIETGEEKWEWRPQAKRGKVSGFSQKSKNRLYLLIDSYMYPADLFLTLTMPGNGWEIQDAACDSGEWKRALDRFRKLLSREYPEAYATWKLEPQKRGAPHYHLLLWFNKMWFSEEEKNAITEWMRCAWTSVCSRYYLTTEMSKNHWIYGTDCQWTCEIEDEREMLYISKYVGKAVPSAYADAWEYPGRWWGEFNKKHRPCRVHREIEVTVEEFQQVRRLVSRWVKSRERARYRLKGIKGQYHKRIRKHDCFYAHISYELVLSMLEHVRGCPVVVDVMLTYPDNDHWMTWPRYRHKYERGFETYHHGKMVDQFGVEAPF